MRRSQIVAAIVLYAGLLAGFWTMASRSVLRGILGEAFPAVFAGFALILAPLLAFGFGADGWLRSVLDRPPRQICAGLLFSLPYLISAYATGVVRWPIAVAFAAIPAVLAAMFALVPATDASGAPRLGWEDAVAFLALAVPIVLHVFGNAWPQPGLAGLPKLLLTDAALYLYLVVRKLPGVGYDLRLRLRDLAIGAREWIFFAPIAIALGFALGFLHWHHQMPAASRLLGGIGFTFVFIAIPEEIFFRGLLLNLLETRLRPRAALVVSAVLFGLSHFNKGSVFNWRYVLLAAIAGIFYGRAWRGQRRIGASAIAHTLVDVTWSAWFR